MGSKATASVAPDMSIISNDKAHGVRGLERSEEEMRLLFEDWIVKHGWAYNAPGEKERRFEIFKDNVRRIDAHNAEADAGHRTWQMGLNQFTDMNNEDFQGHCCGYRPRAKVAAVKDQGSCDFVIIEGFICNHAVGILSGSQLCSFGHRWITYMLGCRH